MSSEHEKSEDTLTYETFDSMELDDNLVRGIYTYGFERPSSIQKLAIVPMKNCKDIMAQSQSGTGKTGAFVIGSLSCVDPFIRKPQILVMCPTRELSQQIESVVKQISYYMNIVTLSATGGTSLRTDMSTLEYGVHYIVGTPGRIYDLIKRNAITVSYMKYVILDEADQMLDALFIEQIRSILNCNFPHTTGLALFSATMPDTVVNIANQYMKNPIKILLQPDKITLDGIKQYYVNLDRDEWKLSVLLDLYQNIAVNQTLIYVNKRHKAEWLAKQMGLHGFTLEYIHGDMDALERKKRLADFRTGIVRVLISTDLLARGIDVQQVSLVINYEMPIQHENYIHRIGRSGRYGKKGIAINLVCEDEINAIKEIESYYSTTIEELPEDLQTLLA
jgi:translation initiation factor 4A